MTNTEFFGCAPLSGPLTALDAVHFEFHSIDFPDLPMSELGFFLSVRFRHTYSYEAHFSVYEAHSSAKEWKIGLPLVTHSSTVYSNRQEGQRSRAAEGVSGVHTWLVICVISVLCTVRLYMHSGYFAWGPQSRLSGATLLPPLLSP